MSLPQTSAPALQIEGVVCRVDIINRELVIRANKTQWVFDVPAYCDVELHSERVKFRMVQPRDRVNIVYEKGRGLLVARFIKVQPGHP